jgi:hypothetical protein
MLQFVNYLPYNFPLNSFVFSFYSYVETGCTAIKIILRNFSSVIKGNITAPPSIGVDITREERYVKINQSDAMENLRISACLCFIIMMYYCGEWPGCLDLGKLAK